MHRPPAVSHTVGRSSWHLGVIAALSGVALLSAALLASSNSLPALRWSVFPVVACCMAWVLFGWARSASGKLQWDGQHWLWSGFADAPVHQAQLILDFQGLLLLKVTNEMGDVAWLWLQGRMNNAHWLAVRRAVVFSQMARELEFTSLERTAAGPAP